MRSASRFVFGLLLLASAACGTRNEDINRVVAPYLPKSYLDGEWYLRSTVVDTPPDHGWLSVADGDWLMIERVKFEFIEANLIAWRTYAYAPGSEAELSASATEFYKGQMVGSWPTTYFDITRGFDPTTGEQTNEIVENQDRQWYDRDFVRVNWAANGVRTTKNHMNLMDPYGFDFVIGNLGNPVLTVGPEEPGSTKRNRFEPGYFEFTARTGVIPDVAAWFGLYGMPFTGNEAGALIDVRHSFYKVPASDYIGQDMPPAVTLEDENGDEVRDERGFRRQLPVNDRFGYFGSLGRNTFDQNRGMVQSGQIFKAARFNLWQKNKDDAGNEIPLNQRVPKEAAITYYTNVEHPEQMYAASQQVAEEWNKAFRETVWKIAPDRYTGALDRGVPSDVPNMFVLKKNDCNIENVGNVLASLEGVKVQLRDGEMFINEVIARDAARTTVNNLIIPFDGAFAGVKARFDAANAGINNYTCTGEDENSFTQLQLAETQALNDLERICSALEYYTNNDITTGYRAPDVAGFHYQRLGDTRYSLFNLLVSEFQAGWLGLGPPYADPITGQTISATANIAMNGLDTYAARAAQFVSVMNGEETLNELAYGLNISDYMADKLIKSPGLVSRNAPGVQEKLESRLGALMANGRDEALREIPPQRMADKFAAVAGTDFEQKLVTPADVQMFGNVALGSQATMTDGLMDAVSPIRGNNVIDRFQDRSAAIARMGQRAMDPPEMIDSMVIGRAIKYRDMSCGERFRNLRQDIYRAVQLHEVGHNTGMFHNFAGSSDAINFGKTFWELDALDTDLETAAEQLANQVGQLATDRLAQVESCLAAIERARSNPNVDTEIQQLTTQQCLQQSEGMYSSIMDYHANWNSDANGLGMYDLAATKFAYGNLVETFPEANLKAEYRNTAGKMKEDIFYGDWRNIPDMFEGATRAERIEKMHEREYKVMNWNTSSTRDVPAANEVPYRFGWGAYEDLQTKVFDFGPDTQMNAEFQLLRYYQHYFFSHFARDRLWEFGDGVNAALNSDLGVLADFTEKMQWMFFYRTQDPKFTPDTYMYQDLLKTTTTGLNFISNVIGEPTSGRFHSAPKFDVFGASNDGIEERVNAPSNILLPATNFSSCELEAINEGEDGALADPDPGYTRAQVPLGDGRPFFVGFRDDYEENYLTYVGHFWTKQFALQYLAMNQAFFPRFDQDTDWRTYDVSWYRMFPNEVGSIFSKLAAQQSFQELGPLYDEATETVIYRDLLDPATGEAPDYSGMQHIPPQIAINHEYFALLLANVLMSSQTDDTIDMAKIMRVAQAGGEDDMAAYDAAAAVDATAGCDTDSADYPACASVITFTHPVTGLTYRALKVGPNPTGFNIVIRLNALKDRFVRMQGCLNEVVDTGESLDPYCGCYRVDRLDAMAGLVCNADGYTFYNAGNDLCSELDIRNRTEGAREQLDELVDYVNDLRSLTMLTGN